MRTIKTLQSRHHKQDDQFLGTTSKVINTKTEKKKLLNKLAQIGEGVQIWSFLIHLGGLDGVFAGDEGPYVAEFKACPACFFAETFLFPFNGRTWTSSEREIASMSTVGKLSDWVTHGSAVEGSLSLAVQFRSKKISSSSSWRLLLQDAELM